MLSTERADWSHSYTIKSRTLAHLFTARVDICENASLQFARYFGRVPVGLVVVELVAEARGLLVFPADATFLERLSYSTGAVTR